MRSAAVGRPRGDAAHGPASGRPARSGRDGRAPGHSVRRPAASAPSSASTRSPRRLHHSSCLISPESTASSSASPTSVRFRGPSRRPRAAAGARLALTYPSARLEENVRELAAQLDNPLLAAVRRDERRADRRAGDDARSRVRRARLPRARRRVRAGGRAEQPVRARRRARAFASRSTSARTRSSR